MKSITLLFLVLVFGIVACNPLPETKPAKFTRDSTEVLTEMLLTASFSSIEFKTNSSRSNLNPTRHEIEIILYNGLNLPKNERGLDSLTRVIGSITKHSISNIEEFEWVVVTIERKTDSTALQSLGTFPFLPKELE